MSAPNTMKNMKKLSFKHLQFELETIVEDLHAQYELDKGLIHNIVVYTKCLVKPGTEEIDELIFTLQMVHTFGITDKLLLGRMYSVFKDNNLFYMTYYGYSRCICTLLSTDLNILSAYTFAVYDINNDGQIHMTELYQLLKTCVIATDAEDIDQDDNVRDVVDIVINTTGFDRRPTLSREEYMDLVKKDILQLQIFGKCLPTESAVHAFLKIISGPTPVEIQRIFRHERNQALMNLESSERESKLYPFHLELP